MSGYGVWRQPCDGSQDPAAKQCWFTMFAATGARQLLPCLDEPSSKAVFDVRIARTEGWRTLFNTPVNYTEPVVQIVANEIPVSHWNFSSKLLPILPGDKA